MDPEDRHDNPETSPGNIAPPPAEPVYMPPPPAGAPQGYWAPAPKQPSWPTVIGVISIIWASLTLICTPINIAGTLAGAPGTRGAGQAGPNGFDPYSVYPDWYFTFSLIGQFIALGMGVLLLVAAIKLCKRRAVARTMHLIWAWTTLGLGILNMGIALSVMDMSDAPDMMRPMVYVGVAIGAAIAFAWPIFLVAWFMRSKTRDQLREMEAAKYGQPTDPANPYGYQQPY